MKDFEFSLDDDADFMLKNFKKNFMIWVVPVTEVLSYLVRKVWSRAVYPRSFPSGHAKLSKFLYHQIVLKSNYAQLIFCPFLFLGEFDKAFPFLTKRKNQDT